MVGNATPPSSPPGGTQQFSQATSPQGNSVPPNQMVTVGTTAMIKNPISTTIAHLFSIIDPFMQIFDLMTKEGSCAYKSAVTPDSDWKRVSVTIDTAEIVMYPF